MDNDKIYCTSKIKQPELSKLRLIKEIYNDPERKPKWKIFKEIIYLSFINRSFPPHYYSSRYLFKNGRDNIRDFCPQNLFIKVNNYFNDNNDREILENKLFFDLYLSQFSVPMPKLLAYNQNNMFVADKKITEVNNLQDFRLYLKSLADRIPHNDSIFIKKTCGSYGGDRVFKIYKHQILEDDYDITKLYNEVIHSEYLFQEKVNQNGVLDSINSSCLNTIRIDTFIDSEQKVEVISAYLRTSLNGLHVDNISSGGCLIPIDMNSGKLLKYGYPFLITQGVKTYTKHPITNIVFENLNIPYFNEVKALVCQVAKFIPGLRLVGWDVAISDSGPVLIEGNSFYDASGGDLGYGGYLRHPVFRKALQEMNYFNKK